MDIYNKMMIKGGMKERNAEYAQVLELAHSNQIIHSPHHSVYRLAKLFRIRMVFIPFL
jgi:hypothetical protein